MAHRKKNITVCSLLCIALTAACYLLLCLPNRNLRLLVGGSKDVEISYVKIISKDHNTNTSSRKILNDGESLAYISEALRNSKCEGQRPKGSKPHLFAQLTFGSIGVAEAKISEFDGTGITIEVGQLLNEPLYYRAKFPDPVPPLLIHALSFN